MSDNLEPNEYFSILKGKVTKAEQAVIDKQLRTVMIALQNAHDLGQKTAVHKLAFTFDTLGKEAALLAKGIDTFVYKDDITQFVEKIVTDKKKRPIKIIELERYPRIIPADAATKIKAAKALEIFDAFCVVFTDLSDDAHMTQEEQSYVQRNRDPIVFGYFKNDTAKLHHERFYFIADWEDEYCDLTFTKMIEQMSEMGIKDAEHTIEPTLDNINRIVVDALKEVEQSGKNRISFKKKSWWGKIFSKGYDVYE